VTHQYTLLVGGVVIPGDGQPDCSAIAWAQDMVIALGSDDAVMAISRGDSTLIDLAGAVVVPVSEGTLEAGGPADLELLDGDPRAGRAQTLAVVRDGHVVSGALPPPITWPGTDPSG
jgi:predicted amidohydrolase YtcJ